MEGLKRILSIIFLLVTNGGTGECVQSSTALSMMYIDSTRVLLWDCSSDVTRWRGRFWG